MKLKSIKIAVNRTEAVVRELETPILLREDTELHEIIRKHVNALMRELIEQHADPRSILCGHRLPPCTLQAGHADKWHRHHKEELSRTGDKR
jgi:hypothetical protein